VGNHFVVPKLVESILLV